MHAPLLAEGRRQDPCYGTGDLSGTASKVSRRAKNVREKTLGTLAVCAAVGIAVIVCSTDFFTTPSHTEDLSLAIPLSDAALVSFEADDEERVTNAHKNGFQRMELSEPHWFMRQHKMNVAKGELLPGNTARANNAGNGNPRAHQTAAPTSNGGQSSAQLDITPIMDENACIQFLCSQLPPILDHGASLLAWQKKQTKSDADLPQIKTCIDKQSKTDWRSTDPCKYGQAEGAKLAQEQKDAAAKEEATKAAQTAKVDKFMENAKSAEATISTPEERENPNAQSFVPVPPDAPNCALLHDLPGVSFLSSGYDPAIKDGCQFDECRMRPIFAYTFNECRTVSTPGGTFKIPDQIRVLNKYETSASTEVYENRRQYEKAMSAKLGASGWGVTAGSSYSEAAKSDDNMHFAIRKINVKLYSLVADPTNAGLAPDFVADAKDLPLRFNDNPHVFLRFLRKWGRYSTRAASYGGTVEINLRSTSSADSSSYRLGVEMAFDRIVSGKSSFENSQADKNLLENSEVSLETSGGDPTIAAAITDLTPATHKTATFRTDLILWLQSVPRFPRLMQRIPEVEKISNVLPTATPGLSPSTEEDRFEWQMRKRALDQAISIMDQSPAAAMHSETQECSTQGYVWQDFNRFSTGECLSFTAHTSGSISLALTQTIGKTQGQVLLNIGLAESNIESDETGTVSKIWASSDQRVLAAGSDKLAGLYWFCLSPAQGTRLQFGVRDKQLVDKVIDRIITPRYFGLKCESSGHLSHITVDKVADYMSTIDEANRLDLQANGQWALSRATPNEDFTLRGGFGEGSRCWTKGAQNTVVMEASDLCLTKDPSFLWRRLANGALKHVRSGLCVQNPAAISSSGCETKLVLGPTCTFAVVFDNSLPSMDTSGAAWAGQEFYNAIFVHDGKDYCVHENPHFSAVFCTCSSGEAINWLGSRSAVGADAWCKRGYKTVVGDVPGYGSINGKGGGQLVSSCDACGDLCMSEETCRSYECSSSELKCNLNTLRDPTAVQYKDFSFCSQICTSGYELHPGSFLQGGTIATNREVSSCQHCGDLCANEATCRAYECSESDGKCELHEMKLPTSEEPKAGYFTCTVVQPKAPDVGVTLGGGVSVGPCAEFDGKPLIYLDRQRVVCHVNIEAIQSFRFRRCGGINFHAETDCRGHRNLIGPTSVLHQTACQDGANNNLEYLDRHHVMCPTNQALIGWVMKSCGGNSQRIEYECRPALLAQQTHHDNNCAISRGEKLQYLDRQNAACPNNKVMVGWQFVSDGCPGGQQRMRTWCSVVLAPQS